MRPARNPKQNHLLAALPAADFIGSRRSSSWCRWRWAR
jgi:hypothetical protein